MPARTIKKPANVEIENDTKSLKWEALETRTSN